MRSINKIMSIALFNAGTPQQQMLEIFHEAGIVSPSKKGQVKMLEKVYEEAKRVSLEQLKKNRLKHVKACRKVERTTVATISSLTRTAFLIVLLLVLFPPMAMEKREHMATSLQVSCNLVH